MAKWLAMAAEQLHAGTVISERQSDETKGEALHAVRSYVQDAFVHASNNDDSAAMDV